MRKGKQTFLNPAHSCDGGAITWYVETRKNSDGEVYLESSLDVWDCSRKVYLSIDARDRHGYKQRLTKVRKLKASIDALEKAYLEAGRDAGWEGK